MATHPLVAVLGVCAALVAIAAVAGYSAAPGAVHAAAQRPNVIVLMTDDETASDMAVMPRTRRLLGERGVTFENSYAAAAARPGKPLDGRSLLPFARHPGRRSRRPLLHETGGRRYVSARDHDAGEAGAVKRVMTYRAVRTPRWLYVEYRAGARELYDLKHDPDELRSRDADPRYVAVRASLHRELRRLASCRSAACRRPLPRLSEPLPAV